MASEVPPVELYREVAFPRRTIYERIMDGEEVRFIENLSVIDGRVSMDHDVSDNLTQYLQGIAAKSVVFDVSSVWTYLHTIGRFPSPMPPSPPMFENMVFEIPAIGESVFIESETDEDGWHLFIWPLTSRFSPEWGQVIVSDDVSDVILQQDGTIDTFLLGGDVRREGKLPNGTPSPNPILRDFPEEYRQNVIERINVCLAAMAFASCRNVRLVDRPDTRTRQQRRDDERKGRELVTFKVLEIGGIADVYDGPAAKSINPGKRSLHICRGHFSEYTEDKPLFGKYSGRFWIPAHTRGTMDKGRVIKDYRILPPVEATA